MTEKREKPLSYLYIKSEIPRPNNNPKPQSTKSKKEFVSWFKTIHDKPETRYQLVDVWFKNDWRVYRDGYMLERVLIPKMISKGKNNTTNG